MGSLSRSRVLVAMVVVPSVAAGALAAPTIGPQFRIDTGGPFWANETTASAAEGFPDRIVTGWNDYREPPEIRSAFGVSFDGGLSWSDFVFRPLPPFQASVEGDPMVAHDDRTGTLWIGAISFSASGGIYVARLDPGATEFNPPVMARTGPTDKGWMAAGPRPGEPDSTRLYCAYNLGLIWSDDMGDTWTDPVPLGSGIGFLPRVGPGGEVYVAYWDFGTGVKLKRSLDGGASFTDHTIATRMDVWGTMDGSRFPGGFRVPSINYLDVDPSNGTLYAVYFDTSDIDPGPPIRWNVDLFFTKSVDRGESWSTPEVINQDGSPTGDQFFPWIEVSRGGRLDIVWLDSRNVDQPDGGPGSTAMLDAYYMYSTDSGDTWTEARLTPQSWSTDGVSFIGDYSGMAVAGNRVYPVYIQMDPGGDQNIYSNVIEFPLCPWDCSGDNDQNVGIADFLALLGGWGGAACDVDGDGTVGIADFLELLANWGPCP